MNHIWGEERECDKVVWGFRKWTIIGEMEWVSYWEKTSQLPIYRLKPEGIKKWYNNVEWHCNDVTLREIFMTSRSVTCYKVMWYETWLKDLSCAVDLLNETIRFLDNFDLDVKSILVTSDVCRFRRFSDKIGISTNFTYLFWQFSYGVSIVEHLHR